MHCMVLGATGSIGSAIVDGQQLQGFTVWRVARSLDTDTHKYLLKLLVIIQSLMVMQWGLV